MRHLPSPLLAPLAAALLLAGVAPATQLRPDLRPRHGVQPRHDARPRPVLVRRVPVSAPPTREDTLRALHLLSRATFGARPGDLAEVLRVGADAWLDRQLRPERIDDSALEARLARFPASAMSAGELLAAYPPPRADPAARAGRDSLRRAPEAAGDGDMAMRPGLAADSGVAMRADGAAPARPRRGQAGGGAPRGPQAILFDLAGAKLQRAVYSDRQLQEVMTDFWFNHFNVFFGKNLDRYLVSGYERDAIRPHVFGRFRDLLGATAKHPAMLVYLDNARSIVPDSMRRYSPAFRGGAQGMPGGGLERRQRARRMAPGDSAAPAAQRDRPRGLNENYARELMELHTLGVDGGYTQHDVVDVARALTGWTVDRGMGRRNGEMEPRFVFRPQLHDFGPKTILGTTFPAGRGVEEGEAVLDLLARSPATARHVARKLAQRFVADDPPPALVERLAQTFLRTDGDLAAVTRALFTSPEFADPRYRAAKVKTPLEFVASTLRATGAEVGPSRGVLQALRQLGQVPYMSSAPTGYPAASAEWTNSGAMLNRMNFALALAAGRLDGVSVDAERFRPALREAGTQARVAALARALMPGGGDPRLLATVAADVERQAGGDAAAARALGLLLASPDFQRR